MNKPMTNASLSMCSTSFSLHTACLAAQATKACSNLIGQTKNMKPKPEGFQPQNPVTQLQIQQSHM